MMHEQHCRQADVPLIADMPMVIAYHAVKELYKMLLRNYKIYFPWRRPTLQ